MACYIFAGRQTEPEGTRRTTWVLTLSAASETCFLIWGTSFCTGTFDHNQLILFPGDAKLERVKEAGEKSRVYLLRFEGNPPRQFYWMQEPDEAKDEILVKALNEALGASDDSMER